jgi:transposase
MKKYRVTLTQEERTELHALLKKERIPARKRTHAQILLQADEADGQPAWTDEQIATAYHVRKRTVERIRQRFVEHGFAAALQARAPQDNYHRKFDGAKEAKLIQLACSQPPAGYARWTLQLLADELVHLHVLDSISDEGVRQVLKKTNLSLG